MLGTEELVTWLIHTFGDVRYGHSAKSSFSSRSSQVVGDRQKPCLQCNPKGRDTFSQCRLKDSGSSRGIGQDVGYQRLEKWVVRFTRDGREGERLVHEDQIPEDMRVEHCEGDSTWSTFLPPYS